MNYLKVKNYTNDNYKIKIKNKNYKIPKKCDITIEYSEDIAFFEIIDPSFYDFKSLLKLYILFFFLFIPYVFCLSFGNMEFHYSFLCDFENVDSEISLIKKEEELFVESDKSNLTLRLNKKSSRIIYALFNFITLLLYCLIAFTIYMIFS